MDNPWTILGWLLIAWLVIAAGALGAVIVETWRRRKDR